MWIAFATDMGALAIISGGAKVHEPRSQVSPDQMLSWLRIGRHWRALRVKSGLQTMPAKVRSITLPWSIFPVPIFCACGLIQSMFIISSSSDFWQSTAIVSFEKWSETMSKG
jgi:hypothetical protein